MSAVTASLCSALMFVLVFVSASADKKIITAESGQDVTLTCRAPVKNNKITVVQWSRADLEDQNVFVDQDGHFVPDNQHPSFKNRVDLQDRQMKDGDVSLILNNVTINDTGTYECRVIMEEKRLLKISIINLSVVDPPGLTGGQEKDGGKEEGGPVGPIVVTFSLLVLVLAVAVSSVRLITKQHFKTLDPESTQRLYALQMDSYSNDLKMN